MEITIKINGQAVSVEVSYEVYEYLCESDRKSENLSHQKRRNWDMREFDEYIIATECRHIYSPTPEEILCHRETMSECFLVTLMIERTFGGNVWYLSINEIIGFAGMVLGGLLLGTWGGFKNRNKTYAVGMLAYGVFAILLGFSSQFILFVTLMFCVSFFIPVVQTASMTMLQEKTAPEMQGRVFSLLNVMFSGFMPLGMAVFGPLADVMPIGFLMIGTGGIIAIMGLMIPCSKAFYQEGMMAVSDTTNTAE